MGVKVGHNWSRKVKYLGVVVDDRLKCKYRGSVSLI